MLKIQSVYIIVEFFEGEAELIKLINKIKKNNINKYALDIKEKLPGKYNTFVPEELLFVQYIEDVINIDRMKDNL